MNKKIIVYGHAYKSEYGFPTERDLIEYLQNKLFSRYSRRYHFTQNKKANIIIVSRDGFAYGHLNVEDMEDPTPQDKEPLPALEWVTQYVVAPKNELLDHRLYFKIFNKIKRMREWGSLYPI